MRGRRGFGSGAGHAAIACWLTEETLPAGALAVRRPELHRGLRLGANVGWRLDDVRDQLLQLLAVDRADLRPHAFGLCKEFGVDDRTVEGSAEHRHAILRHA